MKYLRVGDEQLGDTSSPFCQALQHAFQGNTVVVYSLGRKSKARIVENGLAWSFHAVKSRGEVIRGVLLLRHAKEYCLTRICVHGPPVNDEGSSEVTGVRYS